MKPSWMFFLVLIAITSFIGGCAPVTATVPIASLPDDAAECTAATLRSLGYEIVDDGGPYGIKAERGKHVRNPFRGQADSDRVTVVIADQRLRARGETVRVGSDRLEPRHTLEQPRFEPQERRIGASTEVRADVERLTQTCGSAGG